MGGRRPFRAAESPIRGSRPLPRRDGTALRQGLGVGTDLAYTIGMTTQQAFKLYDAMNAALELLKQKRTKGSFELYLACQDAWRTLTVPPYETRKALREATLAIGRTR